MRKAILRILTVLIFFFFIAVPCHAQKEIEQSLSKGVAYGTQGMFEKACSDWKTACELGDCTYYDQAKKSGDCNQEPVKYLTGRSDKQLNG